MMFCDSGRRQSDSTGAKCQNMKSKRCVGCSNATHVGVETVVELVLSLLLLVASGGLLVLLSGVETLVGVELGVLDDLGLRVLGVWGHFRCVEYVLVETA